MIPPDDWSDDDDILANLNGAADDSKATQPLSTRSRSSSKVRFAEDADDFDVRSNPSTSSRSIPERWGGMEIPDAERDLGKEIFYQVSQQAFNEIIDTLFKVKEDLAVQAAETKEARDEYRPAFESINPDEEKETEAGLPKPSQDQTLQELLAASGYAVDQRVVSQTEAKPGDEEEADEDGETSDDDDESMPALVEDDAPASEPSPTEHDTYRDPTMPQFRPNALTAPREHKPAEPPSPSPTHSEKSSTDNPSKTTTTTTTAADSNTKPGTSPSPKPIPRSTLINWKRLDLAEEEAKARGGWGRLSFDEFERIYRAAEARGARLDYLGTWIDFCIPSI